MIGRIKKIGADILQVHISKNNIHDVIAMLEENEVDIDCKNINGQTPLHFAVMTQNRTMIKTLLLFDNGLNIPNIADNKEVGLNTPMHRATELNMIDIVDLFITYGGDP